MKSHCLKTCQWVASASLLLLVTASMAGATVTYSGLAGGTPGNVGPGLPSPSIVPGKEYSHDVDQTTTGGGGISDPEQVIAWDGIGGTADGLDYSSTRIDYTNNDQVDATANRRDHLFNEVLGSEDAPDRAHLIFSHDDQISVYFGGGPPVVGGYTPFPLSPAYSGGPFTLANGTQIGGTGELSYELATAFSPPSSQGIWANQGQINGMPNPVDVDGVEVWGPEPAFKADAEKYSLNTDLFSNTSVWSLDLSTNVSTPYISRAQIDAAVVALLGLPPGSAVLPYPTPIEGIDAINLDALMVQDIINDGTGPDTFDRDPGGGVGDRIIFSISQIPDPQDPDGYYATGSEIFVLDASQPNNPMFLYHGGHLWNQAYALANLLVSPNLIDNGYAVIDVNAIEAISEGVVPEPTCMMLLLAGLAVISGWRSRR